MITNISLLPAQLPVNWKMTFVYGSRNKRCRHSGTRIMTVTDERIIACKQVLFVTFALQIASTRDGRPGMWIGTWECSWSWRQACFKKRRTHSRPSIIFSRSVSLSWLVTTTAHLPVGCWLLTLLLLLLPPPPAAFNSSCVPFTHISYGVSISMHIARGCDYLLHRPIGHYRHSNIINQWHP